MCAYVYWGRVKDQSECGKECETERLESVRGICQRQ